MESPTEICIYKKPTAITPCKATVESAGFDLYAHIVSDTIVGPSVTLCVPTGIIIASMPSNIEGQIRSRSGLALKNNIIVLNAPGTIDPDYRGEIKVILKNISLKYTFMITPGMRIAQLVFSRLPNVDLLITTKNKINDTDRGAGGFGSTGL
jgi:dUTP pyrophosphatase